MSLLESFSSVNAIPEYVGGPEEEENGSLALPGQCRGGVHRVPGPGQRPALAADDRHRVGAVLAGGYHPGRDELALLRHGQAEGTGDQRVVVLVPEDQDALGAQVGARAAVAAGAPHEVILLRDGGQLGPADDPALHAAEQLVGPGPAVVRAARGPCAEDPPPDLRVQAQEEVPGQPPVGRPQLADPGPAGRGELAFRVAVGGAAQVGLAYPDQPGGPGTAGVVRGEDQAEMA